MGNLKIAVYGSAGDSSKLGNISLAKDVGRAIAKNDCVTVTGACPGLPHEAVLGAADMGGEAIGFSPARDIEEQKKFGLPTIGFSEIRYIPKDFEYGGIINICHKYRNVYSAAFVDACIVIDGKIGSLNEFTNLFDMGKVIGVLEGSGGVADGIIPDIVRTIHKNTGARVIFEKDPEILVRKVVEEVADRK